MESAASLLPELTDAYLQILQNKWIRKQYPAEVHAVKKSLLDVLKNAEKHVVNVEWPGWGTYTWDTNARTEIKKALPDFMLHPYIQRAEANIRQQLRYNQRLQWVDDGLVPYNTPLIDNAKFAVYLSTNNPHSELGVAGMMGKNDVERGDAFRNPYSPEYQAATYLQALSGSVYGREWGRMEALVQWERMKRGETRDLRTELEDEAKLTTPESTLFDTNYVWVFRRQHPFTPASLTAPPFTTYDAQKPETLFTLFKEVQSYLWRDALTNPTDVNNAAWECLGHLLRNVERDQMSVLARDSQNSLTAMQTLIQKAGNAIPISIRMMAIHLTRGNSRRLSQLEAWNTAMDLGLASLLPPTQPTDLASGTTIDALQRTAFRYLQRADASGNMETLVKALKANWAKQSDILEMYGEPMTPWEALFYAWLSDRIMDSFPDDVVGVNGAAEVREKMGHLIPTV